MPAREAAAPPRPSSAPAVSPEMHLLLRCARTQPDAACLEKIHHLVQQELDWERVARLAKQHAVTPLLYHTLKQAAPGAVPPKTFEQLRRRFHAATRHNLLLAHELGGLLALLEEKGLPAIPLKGPVLAQTAYGSLTLRPCGDLDVLVREEDFRAVEEVLTQEGYAPAKDYRGLRRTIYLRFQQEYPFVHEARSVHVDVHTALGPRRFHGSPDFDALLQRAHRTTVGGIPAHDLALQDALPFLCAHGTRHRWEALKWLCDVAELVRGRPHLDWSGLFERARTLHAERVLCLGLYLAETLLGVDLPGDVRQHLRACSARQLARPILTHLLGAPLPPAGLRERLGFHLAARDGLIDRVRYGWYLLPLLAEFWRTGWLSGEDLHS